MLNSCRRIFSAWLRHGLDWLLNIYCGEEGLAEKEAKCTNRMTVRWDLGSGCWISIFEVTLSAVVQRPPLGTVLSLENFVGEKKLKLSCNWLASRS